MNSIPLKLWRTLRATSRIAATALLATSPMMVQSQADESALLQALRMEQSEAVEYVGFPAFPLPFRVRRRDALY